MIRPSGLGKIPAHFTKQQAESFLAAYRPKEKEGRRYAVRDILRDHFDDYVQTHPVSHHTEKTARTLMKCGTGELGYSLRICANCQTIQMTADKCGCRYCSSCGYLRKMRWIQERQAELIEGIPYFHLVFTVPHELNSLIFQNQKAVLNNLFRSVSHTILELSAERKKMIPGMIMILHTFGSAMTLHYHIHMLVSGGGLSLDKQRFISQRSRNFFLPAAVVRARYRALFLQGMKELHNSGSLEYFGDAEKYRNTYEWKELLDSCYKQQWNVEIRKYFSPSSGQNAAGSFSRYANRNAVSDDTVRYAGHSSDSSKPPVSTAVNYLAEYSSRSAITDNRIRSVDTESVSFEYKDYRSGGNKKIMTLSADEFIRRFLLHILPAGVQKIRYAGYLAGSVKKKNLALIRKTLGQKAPENPTKGLTAAQLVKTFWGIDFSVCQNCGTVLLSIGHRMDSRMAAETIVSFQARAS